MSRGRPPRPSVVGAATLAGRVLAFNTTMTTTPTLLSNSTASALNEIAEQNGLENADQAVAAVLAAADEQGIDLANLTDGDDAGDGTSTAGRLEQMAESALTLRDLRHMEREQLSSVEHLRETYDVDPAEYDDADELRERVRSARAELTEQTSGRGPTT